MNKEIKYLKTKVSEISYYPYRFKLFVEEDKFIYGMTSPNWQTNIKTQLICDFMKISTLYDTLQDLDWKIKFSFEEAIKYSYSEPLQKEFNLIELNPNDKEKLAYYYIENLLFRLSILWDILAQLYCLYYKIPIPKTQIYYNKLFNLDARYIKSNSINKIQTFKDFKTKVTTIKNYLQQEDDDTELYKQWKGNHRFINELRNKMTHRNSPNVPSMSNFDINNKHHPTYLLKRIVEDYNVVSKYIDDILTDIEKDFSKLYLLYFHFKF